MSNGNKFEPAPHYIAYLDILGYKEKIGKDGENAAHLAEIIDSHIKRAKRISLNEETKEDSQGSIKLKAFSDNILLCTETNWAVLYSLVAVLQGRMIEDGIFIRGSLTYGSLYFDTEFLCGQGIILAHEIESEISIYPRVVVHKTYMDAVDKYLKTLNAPLHTKDAFEYHGAISQVFCDFDGYMVLDYLLSSNQLAPYQDKKNEITKRHKEEIVKNLQIKKERVRQKFLWCKNYHNNFIERAMSMGFQVREHYIEDV